MKKILFLLLAVMLLAAFAVTAQATDNGEDDRIEALDAATVAEETETAAEVTAEIVTDEPEPTPGKLPETFSWKYLASTGGAAIAVFFIIQYAKVKLDKVWKIPTRLLVYLLSLAILLIANGFLNHGVTAEMVALTVFNALISAFSAFGMYEVWIRKKESAT